MKQQLLMLVILVLVGLIATQVRSAAAPHILTFCYEDKELYPHYLQAGASVPVQKPGAAIDIMKQLDSLIPAMEVKYIRKPWKRCLNELKQSRVDALIGRYTEERAEFSHYPRLADDRLDVSKAISKTTSCFIHDKALPFDWDGTTVNVKKPIGLIAPMGYSVVEDLRQLGFDVYEVSTIDTAHNLLFNGKFQVSLSNCYLRNKPENIVENPIPFTEQFGYLVFSKQYYWANKERAQFIWKKLQTIDKESIYQRYK